MSLCLRPPDVHYSLIHSIAKSGFHENGIDIFSGPIYIPVFVSLVHIQANRGAVNAKDTFLPGNQIQH
jgi:hypothetical protein